MARSRPKGRQGSKRNCCKAMRELAPHLVLDSFCCGCDLRVGTYITAIISVLYALLLAGAPWTLGICGHRFCTAIDGSVALLGKLSAGGLSIQLTVWVAAVLLFLCSLLLIIGAKLGRRHLLMPWLVFSSLYVFLWLSLGIIAFILLCVETAFLLATATLFVSINMALLPVYFIAAVASLYVHLKGPSLHLESSDSSLVGT